MIVTTIFGLFLPSAAHSFYSMWMGNFDTSTWFTALQMSVPFDTSTVFGWYMKYLNQVWASIVFNLVTSTLIPYFANCCCYIGACSEQFKSNYKHLSHDFLKFLERSSKSNAPSTDNNQIRPTMSEIQSQLTDLVRFHIKMFEYVLLFAN